MKWYWIVLITIAAVSIWIAVSVIFYKQFFKRFYDIILSGIALIILSPLLLVLTVVGAIAMHGNPFFVQPRPGKIDPKSGKEIIFNLVKFRTMSNLKDKEGNLLPDADRVNNYGKFLRKTSLDELPELVTVFFGKMSIIGPRPLLVKYLPFYTDREHLRHSVRPGLTGYAQAHGRNTVSWEERFEMDVWYANHISLKTDFFVILDTAKTVFHHDGIVLNALEDFDEYRKNSHTKADVVQS